MSCWEFECTLCSYALAYKAVDSDRWHDDTFVLPNCTSGISETLLSSARLGRKSDKRPRTSQGLCAMLGTPVEHKDVTWGTRVDRIVSGFEVPPHDRETRERVNLPDNRPFRKTDNDRTRRFNYDFTAFRHFANRSIWRATSSLDSSPTGSPLSVAGSAARRSSQSRAKWNHEHGTRICNV